MKRKWLMLLFSMLIVMACVGFVACGDKTQEPDPSGGNAEKPVITLSVEGNSDVRDFVEEDRAPSMRVSVSKCTLSVRCVDPDGEDVDISSSSYRFKVSKLGTYTVYYDAVSPDNVKADTVTYKIFYKDPGVVVTASADAETYAKQQSGWEFEFPAFSDILNVSHAYAGTTTEDYLGRITSAVYTPSEGTAQTISDVESRHSFEPGKVALEYEIAAKSAPAQTITTYSFEMEIEDYFYDTASYTDNKDFENHPALFSTGNETEYLADGMDYYVIMQTQSAYGGLRWEENNPLLQSLNHTENSYLVIDGYNPNDGIAVLYLNVYDYGIYDGSFNGGEPGAEWIDKCYQRGFNPIPGKSYFRITLPRDELGDLKMLDLNFGMDWTNIWEENRVDKTEGVRSDTVYLRKISIVFEGGEETVPVEGLFTASSAFDSMLGPAEGVTLTGSDEGLRFTYAGGGEVRFNLLSDALFASKVSSFVNTETRGKSILVFDITNISDIDQVTSATEYRDAYFNRVMYVGANGVNTYTNRSTLAAGETVTVHVDTTMFSQKQDQVEVINSIFIGAKAACDVLLHNFRIIEL